MKTAVIMERQLYGMPVRQNHKTGLMNANDLHKLGNALRKEYDLSQKQMAAYFNLDATKELIDELCLVDNIRFDEAKKSGRGKNGGTWVHPIIFIDMAMWYSPQLKVKILKWVQDGLLMARDESGDEFKAMMSELSRVFPDEMSNPMRYAEVSRLIASACKVGTSKDKWQKATEEQLKLRKKIQSNAVLLADMSENVGTCISKAIEKAI